MEPQRQRYWFPAKRFGWGWGPPATWQGWVVLAVWVVAVVVGAQRLRYRPGALFLYVLVTAAILIAICFAKGEPPRWRWGGDDDDKDR